MKKLYTKYSNDRASEYQIKTSIVLKDDGSKTVIKSPLCEKADNHINNMLKAYKCLDKCFSDSLICYNVARPFEKGVEFEFLHGITLEEQLDVYLKEGDYKSFKDLFQTFVDTIYEASLEVFEPSEEYEEVFGPWNLQGVYSCTPVTDIDMIFSNVIIQKEEWVVIDYEWTFSFFVPAKFILYRAILYYLTDWRNDVIDDCADMYEMAGISKEERDYFWGAEWNFHLSISKGYNSLSRINDSFGTMKYFPFEIADRNYHEDLEKEGRIKMFKGGEEVRAESYRPVKKTNNSCTYQWVFDNQLVDKIEIYPYAGSCSISINAIFAIDSSGKMEFQPYGCNGQEIGNNKWAFFNNPCIVIENFVQGIELLYIDYNVSKKRPRELMKSILWKEQFLDAINEKERTIFELQRELKELSEMTHEIDEDVN